MPIFESGKTFESDKPTIEVTSNEEIFLPVGKHIFQLEVEDDSGNKSLPDTVEVIVKDSENPTAVLRAPKLVELGKSFTLDGRASSDVAPGRVVKYLWTKVE